MWRFKISNVPSHARGNYVYKKSRRITRFRGLSRKHVQEKTVPGLKTTEGFESFAEKMLYFPQIYSPLWTATANLDVIKEIQ
jgi:hypothetical protein